MDPQDMTYEIARCYASDLIVDQDLADSVNGFRRSRDLARLSTCSTLFDAAKHGVDDWKFLRQIEAFFRKNASFSVRENLRAGAELSFRECEAKCEETNERITNILLGGHQLDARPKNLLFAARRYIERVLGDFSLFSGSLQDLVKVTSGATVNSPRSQSLPQLKLSLRPYCSSGAVEDVRRVYRSFGFDRCKPRVCDENRIELVPKDWRKDRTIACEPEGSLPLQLAFDTWTKRRLRRFGIDLRDQSRNQRLCQHAAIYDDFVTVDFSSASDTVSFATVAWLMPTAWFEYLHSIRSPRYRGVFGKGTYAKFSSMGNGATFALETLIFASLCYACGSRKFLVYGDDVIIEKEYYAEFAQLAEILGFVVNKEKTFVSGPVRESCGVEYFGIHNVTPVYVRNIDARKAVLCHLVNTLGSLTWPLGHLRAFLDQVIDQQKLPLVPYNENTMSGVWVDFETARQLELFRNKCSPSTPRLYYYKAFCAENTRRSFVDSRGYYLWFLYKNSQVLFKGPWELGASCDPLQTSSVPIFTHTYERKWVVYHRSTDPIPPHVFLYGLERRPTAKTVAAAMTLALKAECLGVQLVG